LTQSLGSLQVLHTSARMTDAAALATKIASLTAKVISEWSASSDMAARIVEAAREADCWDLEQLILQENETVCEVLNLATGLPTPEEFTVTGDIDGPAGNDSPVDNITRAQANALSWESWVNHSPNNGWLLQHKDAWSHQISITFPQFLQLMGYAPKQLKAFFSYSGHFFLRQQALPTKDRAREINLSPLLTAVPGLTRYLNPDTHGTVALWFSQAVSYDTPQIKAFRCVFKPVAQWYESQDAADRVSAWKIEGHNITPTGQILSYLFKNPAHALLPPGTQQPVQPTLQEARIQLSKVLQTLVKEHKDIADLFGLQLVSDFIQNNILIPLAKEATREISSEPEVSESGAQAVRQLLEKAASNAITYHPILPEPVPEMGPFAAAAYEYFCDTESNDKFKAMFQLSSKLQTNRNGINPQLSFRNPVTGRVEYRPEIHQGKDQGLKQLYLSGSTLPSVGGRSGSSSEFATPRLPTLPAPTTPVPYAPQQGSEQPRQQDPSRHRAGRGGRQNMQQYDHQHNQGSYGSDYGAGPSYSGPPSAPEYSLEPSSSRSGYGGRRGSGQWGQPSDRGYHPTGDRGYQPPGGRGYQPPAQRYHPYPQRGGGGRGRGRGRGF
jgi:hypothetical protein